MNVTYLPRKKTPDYTLSYQDNVKGLHNDARFDIAGGYSGEEDPGNSSTTLGAAGNTIYKYGFDIEVFLADLEADLDPDDPTQIR